MTDNKHLVYEDECVDDLQLDGLRIIQKKEGFKFGMDAVLLSDFAKDSPSKRTVDLCTGTGIVAILLSAKTKTPYICGVEIQKSIADMAKRSTELNGISDRVEIVEADLKDATTILGKVSFDKVVVNPPYMKGGTGNVNDEDMKTISRHEIFCDIDDVIKAAAGLLVPKGKLFMVHRPQRLPDIMEAMRKYKIEPKRMRLVAPSVGKVPNLLLIEGMLGGGSELRFMPQLYVYDENGNYTEEINKIYNR